MKVTKKMLHPDLQPLLLRMNIARFIFDKVPLVKAVNAAIRRSSSGKDIDGLDCSETYITGRDGATQVRVRIYKPLDHVGPLPCVLYIHGGGYIMGIPEIAGPEIKRFIDTRPCIVISPDYRLAIEHPYPAALHDCYDTLLWAKNNAADLGIRDEKFVIAGHSAGGGLTAAVTLMARDNKDVDIAFQMPIYPMIDDSQPNDPARRMFGGPWDTKTNTFGWHHYHKDLINDRKDIPAYAAPTRNTDYTGFPPTISFVGTHEPFHIETVEYMSALKDAGIDTKFKLYEGCFHGFDNIAAHTEIGRDGIAFTTDSFGAFYDKYVQ